MIELAAVRQGLAMAWNMGFKFLQLELDSKVVLTRLTNNNMNYPTNMMSLICDCRNLLKQKWEVCMQHVYREHGFKNRTGHQTVFFFNFRFNPGFCLVFDRFSGF